MVFLYFLPIIQPFVSLLHYSLPITSHLCTTLYNMTPIYETKTASTRSSLGQFVLYFRRMRKPASSRLQPVRPSRTYSKRNSSCHRHPQCRLCFAPRRLLRIFSMAYSPLRENWTRSQCNPLYSPRNVSFRARMVNSSQRVSASVHATPTRM